MARDFTKSTSNVMQGGCLLEPIVGFSAMSFHAWVISDTITSSAVTNNGIYKVEWISAVPFYVGIDSTGADKLYVICVSDDSVDTPQIAISSTFSTSSWTSVGIVIDYAAQTVKLYRNGVLNGGTQSVTFNSNVLTNLDGSVVGYVGMYDNSSTANHWDGGIAEIAFWKTALTADDFIGLYKGFCPLNVKSSNLVSYNPMIGKSSDEIDLLDYNQYFYTVTGSIPARAHPPVFKPRGSMPTQIHSHPKTKLAANPSRLLTAADGRILTIKY